MSKPKLKHWDRSKFEGQDTLCFNPFARQQNMTYESCVNENWNVWSTLVFILHHSFDFSATQDVGYINKLSQDILGVNLQHIHCFQLLMCLSDSKHTETSCLLWGLGYCKQNTSMPGEEKVMCCKITSYAAWQYHVPASWFCTGCKMASSHSSEWKITETFNLTVLRYCVSKYLTEER